LPARTSAIAVAAERIGRYLLVIRRQWVLLDENLAALYCVEARSLLRATKRNLERIPVDFMFEPSRAASTAWRSPSVTSKPGRSARRDAPYALAEQGAATLSPLLNSRGVTAVDVEIMRSVVQRRKFLEADKSLARKFDRLERKPKLHDQAIVGILLVIRQPMNPTDTKRRGIRFTADLRE
jgi:hypothetical protein